MTQYRKCFVCGERVDISKHHVKYHRDSNVIDYYTEDGDIVYKPMSVWTYEHVGCARLLDDAPKHR